jgi:hypothetical protein
MGALFVAGGFLSAGAIVAQTGGGYDLSWFRPAPGGASSGGAYTLGAVAGLADASRLSGGGYDLEVGFLVAAPTATPTAQPTPSPSSVDLPLIRKD